MAPVAGDPRICAICLQEGDDSGPLVSGERYSAAPDDWETRCGADAADRPHGDAVGGGQSAGGCAGFQGGHDGGSGLRGHS